MSLSSTRSALMRERTSLINFITTLHKLVNGEEVSKIRLIEAKTRLNQLWGEFEAKYEMVEELLADHGHKEDELKTCLNGYHDLQAKVWEEKDKIAMIKEGIGDYAFNPKCLGKLKESSLHLCFNSRSYLNLEPDNTSPDKLDPTVILFGRDSVWKDYSSHVYSHEKAHES